MSTLHTAITVHFKKPGQKEPDTGEQTVNDSICETGKVAFGPQRQEADE